MGNIQFLERFLYSCFQNSKIGHLAKGIIHNLNGPIQILSMHIEMLKMDIEKDLKSIESTLILSLSDTAANQLKKLANNLQGGIERLSQMEEALARMENMVNVITNRSQEWNAGQRPLILNHVLEEELSFWNADLFFKHQVEKQLALPATSTMVVINEGHLRDLIDGLLDACIQQMRETKERDLKLTLRQKNEASWSLEFEHTGNAFPTDWDQDVNRYSPKVNEYTQKISDYLFLILALNLAKVRAEQIGGTLKIEPQKASCLIPNGKQRLDHM
jgi:C4-dicarboxylate-specific signal transduction histidine kinase